MYFMDNFKTLFKFLLIQGSSGGGSSWRSKASEPEDDDRRGRRIRDRSGAGAPPERDSWRSAKDSASSGNTMRRVGLQPPATPQRRGEEPASSAPPLRENRREWKQNSYPYKAINFIQNNILVHLFNFYNYLDFIINHSCFSIIIYHVQFLKY